MILMKKVGSTYEYINNMKNSDVAEAVLKNRGEIPSKLKVGAPFFTYYGWSKFIE